MPTRADDLLGDVHLDMCGPFEVHSLGGNKYFVSFVDEFSRMIWLYLIRTKGEVFDIFKSLKIWQKNKVADF